MKNSTTETFNTANSNAMLSEGKFISSDVEKPPFKTVIEVYTPFGIKKQMYHENENDGYDFANEKPLNLHLISSFDTPILWRLPYFGNASR